MGWIEDAVHLENIASFKSKLFKEEWNISEEDEVNR